MKYIIKVTEGEFYNECIGAVANNFKVHKYNNCGN